MHLKKLGALCLVCAALIGLSGCGKSTSALTATTQETSEAETVTEEKTFCKIEYKTVNFLSDEEKAAWREPLLNVLSEINSEFYFELIDPDNPDPSDRYSPVEASIGIGLLDVTCDGTPEVIAFYAGGSAGNSGCEIYDLYTGEVIGWFGSGWYEAPCSMGNWATYLDRESGVFRVVGLFNTQMGASMLFRTVSLLSEDTESGEIHATPLFVTTLEYDHITDTESIQFSHNGESVYRNAFYDAYEAFFMRYQRIGETALCYIDWDDCPAETHAERAVLMADALLATEQEFIKP